MRAARVRRKLGRELQHTARWKWTMWILSFAQMDLRRLKKEERDSLKREILEFCDLPPVSSFKRIGRILPPVDYTMHEPRRKTICVSDRVIAEFQRAVKDVLNKLLAKTGGHSMIPAAHTKLKRLVFAEKDFIKGNERTSALVYREFSACWPDIFMIRVAEMIETFGSLIDRCTECKALFMRVKRQQYCSRRCGGRVRLKKWYAANKDKAKAQRRARYLETGS